MFSNNEFIQASRGYVCIRIETYESKAAEERVRSLLGGGYANTAFCIYAPDGETRLSRSGRSPGVLAGRTGSTEDAAVINEMNRIAGRYTTTNESPALLQDFDSFRQALNVSSADQRLLIVVNSKSVTLERTLRSILADSDFHGRFHVDRIIDEPDPKWASTIGFDETIEGVLVVRSGQFGVEGDVLAHLPNDAASEDIKQALINNNALYAMDEVRKDHAEHVAAGRRKGIYFENEIPYGEDRDGNGVRDREEGKTQNRNSDRRRR